jgi:hypothetical protein
MKKPIIFLGSLLVLTLVVIFGRDWVTGKVNTSETPKTTSQQPSPIEPPQYVVYHMVFRHVVWLENKADEEQLFGRDGSPYKNRYQKFAGLSDSETQLLKQTATQTVDRVKEIDKRIEILVKADREKRKSEMVGKPLPTSAPPLNPEVTQLDLERQNVILAGYSKLSDNFEGWRFVKFEEFVKKNIASQINSVSQKDASHLQEIPREAQSLKGGRTR